MEVLKDVAKKAGSLIATALIRTNPLLGTIVTLFVIPWSLGIYLHFEKAFGPYEDVLISTIVGIIETVAFHYGRLWSVKFFKGFCKYEPCEEPIKGIYCFEISKEMTIKCYERLRGELKLSGRLIEVRCSPLRRISGYKELRKRLHKAVELLREGDRRGAKRILNVEIEVCV